MPLYVFYTSFMRSGEILAIWYIVDETISRCRLVAQALHSLGRNHILVLLDSNGATCHTILAARRNYVYVWTRGRDAVENGIVGGSD